MHNVLSLVNVSFGQAYFEIISKVALAYEQSLKAIDLLHIKYNEKLNQKDAEYKKKIAGLEKQISNLQ